MIPRGIGTGMPVALGLAAMMFGSPFNAVANEHMQQVQTARVALVGEPVAAQQHFSLKLALAVEAEDGPLLYREAGPGGQMIVRGEDGSQRVQLRVLAADGEVLIEHRSNAIVLDGQSHRLMVTAVDGLGALYVDDRLDSTFPHESVPGVMETVEIGGERPADSEQRPYHQTVRAVVNGHAIDTEDAAAAEVVALSTPRQEAQKIRSINPGPDMGSDFGGGNILGASAVQSGDLGLEQTRFDPSGVAEARQAAVEVEGREVRLAQLEPRGAPTQLPAAEASGASPLVGAALIGGTVAAAAIIIAATDDSDRPLTPISPGN